VNTDDITILTRPEENLARILKDVRIYKNTIKQARNNDKKGTLL